ncbi:MAG: hypothetical protein JZD41_00920, partial [Thermoproteus sp.]|nr:hypothetical protein [Thermoproteus sp.]
GEEALQRNSDIGALCVDEGEKEKEQFVLRGELALELAYNLYEAGVITDEKLAEVEEMARGRVVWYISVGRLALMELGAEFVRPRDKPKDKERA